MGCCFVKNRSREMPLLSEDTKSATPQSNSTQQQTQYANPFDNSAPTIDVSQPSAQQQQQQYGNAVDANTPNYDFSDPLSGRPLQKHSIQNGKQLESDRDETKMGESVKLQSRGAKPKTKDKTITVVIKSIRVQFPLLEITLNWKNSVGRLKKKIHDAAPDKIPPPRQRLIHRGRVVKDNHSLKYYGIDDQSTLMLVRSRKATSPMPELGKSADSTAMDAFGRNRAFTTPNLFGDTLMSPTSEVADSPESSPNPEISPNDLNYYNSNASGKPTERKRQRRDSNRGKSLSPGPYIDMAIAQ